jgi:hypothetical protein
VGQVLSSDGTKVYHVNSHCDCDAGTHGRPCKHVSSWRLYQYVERKMEAQTTPQPEGVGSPYTLPEAPCSINVRLVIDGRDCQLTLRDIHEGRLLERLQVVLAQYPMPQASVQASGQGTNQLSPQQHNTAAMHKKVVDFCPLHNVQMKENHKENRTWYSHYDEAAGCWCKGK